MATSIWNRSPHQQFTLKVGSPSLANKQFAGPWEAYGVVVANNTNQYVYLPDVNFYVPPGVVGATVPLPGLMEATASFTTPPGITALGTVAGQIATLDYFAEELTPYPGVPTNITVINTPAVTISNTPAVTVTSGTVSISNTPSVSITGTPSVIISGTPNVAISGTPTVILGAGTASVGTIAGVTGTVTVAGQVNIGNTPAVTISGTPSVSISSGSVAITGGSINVATAAGVQVQTAQNQKLLGTFLVGPSTPLGVTNTYAIDAGTHAIGVAVNQLPVGATLSRIQIKGAVTGTFYYQAVPPLLASVMIPVLAAADTSITVIVGRSDATVGNSTVYVVEILDSLAVEIVNTGDQSLSVIQGTGVWKNQEVKDTLRTAFAATANAAAGVTVEAMLSLIPVRAGVAAGGTTSITPSASRHLRLTAIVVSYVMVAAAANVSRFYLRTNPAGAVVVTSPLLMVVNLIAPAVVSGLGATQVIPLPDGFEFFGADQVGISHIASAITNVEWVSLIGFEY